MANIIAYVIVWGFLIAGVSLFYFMPSFIAKLRKHPNFSGILIVNLLIGWTGIGWIIALVMACTNNSATNNTTTLGQNF